jgi:nucleotide-binding universal stress UspA family protein
VQYREIVKVSESEPVIVGVDGSETSLRAAAWAVSLVRASHARLVAVYVHQGPVFFAGNVPGAESAIRDASVTVAEQLKAVAAERSIALDIDGTLVERSGDPYVKIVELAKELRAAAIVVGASMSPAHRFAGSVGARLIRRPPCPVIVVP